VAKHAQKTSAKDCSIHYNLSFCRYFHSRPQFNNFEQLDYRNI